MQNGFFSKLYCSPECYTDLVFNACIKGKGWHWIMWCRYSTDQEKERMMCATYSTKITYMHTGINDQEQKHCTGGKSYMCD